MVNVAHDADYRRPCDHIRLVFFILFQQLGNHIHLFFLLAKDIKLHGDFFRLLVIHFLVNRHHLALFLKELAYDHRRLDFHLIGQFLDGNYLRKDDYLYLILLLLNRLLRHDKRSLGGLAAL